MISCIQLRENLTPFFSCLSRTKGPFENVNSSVLSLTIYAIALKPHKKDLLSTGIAGGSRSCFCDKFKQIILHILYDTFVDVIKSSSVTIISLKNSYLKPSKLVMG